MIFHRAARDSFVPEQALCRFSAVILPHAGSSSGAFHIPVVQRRQAGGQSLKERQSVCASAYGSLIPWAAEFETL